MVYRHTSTAVHEWAHPFAADRMKLRVLSDMVGEAMGLFMAHENATGWFELREVSGVPHLVLHVEHAEPADSVVARVHSTGEPTRPEPFASMAEAPADTLLLDRDADHYWHDGNGNIRYYARDNDGWEDWNTPHRHAEDVDVYAPFTVANVSINDPEFRPRRPKWAHLRDVPDRQPVIDKNGDLWWRDGTGKVRFSMGEADWMTATETPSQDEFGPFRQWDHPIGDPEFAQ